MTDGIRAGTAYIDFKGDFTGLKKEIGAQLAPITSKIGGFGTKGAAAFTGITAAAGLTAKALYDTGKLFDDANDRIRIGTGKTGKALSRLEGDFKAVYASVPNGAEEVAEAISDLNSRLGESGKPLRAVARNMLTLSRITETDLGTNIQATTRLFGDWSVAVDKQVPTLNKLWRAHEKTGATVSELAEDLVKFGSPLRQLGFNFDEATAMFAAFEQQGVNTSKLLPGLNIALANFSKPTADLSAEFKQLGVNLRDPHEALTRVLDLIRTAPTVTKANTLAFDVFGRRAGPDLAAAVREGRFDLDKLIGTIRNGKDTIRDAGNDTDDFAEHWREFVHKIQVYIAPVAQGFFDLVNKALVEFVRWNPAKLIRSLGLTRENLRSVGATISALGTVLKATLVDTAGRALKAFGQMFRGSVQLIASVSKTIGDLLHGRWANIWDDAKAIFKGGINVIVGFLRAATAPMRTAAKLIGDGIESAFSGIWDSVKSGFEAGLNAVIGVVRSVIKVINKLPAVKIPLPNYVGDRGSGGRDAPAGDHGGANGTGGRVLARASGGFINTGKPSGDSVPAVLERGEYVLNRKAVEAVGQQNLDRLNFHHAARYSVGGAVGGVISGGAGKLLGLLPDPNDGIPKWLQGTTGWVVDKGADYIKDQVSKFFTQKSEVLPNLGHFLQDTALGGLFGSLSSKWQPNHPQYDVWQMGLLLQSLGFDIAENPHFGGVHPVHTNGSYHYSGRAIDINWPTGGSEELSKLNLIAPYIAKFGPKDPFIEDPGGSNQHGHFAYAMGGLVGKVPVAAMRRGGLVQQVMAGELLRNSLDAVSTAAILGNSYGESGWDPSAMEPGTDNGGLFGFTAGEKSRAALVAYAAKHGKPWDDVVTQVDFMLTTLPASMRNAMNALGDTDAATLYFMDNWERPLDHSSLAKRQGKAAHVLPWVEKMAKAGGGSTGPTDAQIRRREGKARKANRLAKLKTLEALVGKAKTPMGRRSALWDVIQFFGRVGLFDQDSRKHTLDAVRRAGSFANPLGGMKVLSGLMSWLDGHVDLSGQEDVEKSIGDAMKNAREAGQAVGSKRRRKVLSRVALQGLDPRQRKIIEALDGRIEKLGEEIDITDRQAQWPGSPGGTDYSDSEVMDLVGTAENPGKYRKLLGLYKRQRDVVVATRENLAEHLEKIQPLIQAATPRDSRTHWRLGALKANRSKTVGLIDSLGTKLVDLQGLTGQGGLIFDTQDTIKTFTGETETPDNSELSDLLLQLLTEANQRYQVSQAQYPILNPPVMHTGGIVPGPQTADVPIIAQGGEGVFTRSQMDAMGGGMAVAVVVEDGAVDQNKIRVVAGEEAERVQRRTARSAGRITPGGGGPWR